MMKKFLLPIIGFFVLASCNKDVEFPDYEYQTVYFAYQYPVRTITFGEDIFNTDLDNQGKCKIMATTGGVYFSKKNLNIGIAADNSLLGTGLLFGAGKDEVLPMPNNYYTLAANSIVIPEGGLTGGVDVQLTDAFFNDPKADQEYLCDPAADNGSSQAPTLYSTAKDFILYAIKYVNTWHGNYLRRGKDVVTGSVNQTIARHKQYVEDDEVNKLYTRARRNLNFPWSLRTRTG